MEMKTLDQWFKETHTFYYLIYDNKGKFKEAKGIVGNYIITETNKVIKKYVKEKKRQRKNDIYVEVTYNSRDKEITAYHKITKAEYDRHSCWENW